MNARNRESPIPSRAPLPEGSVLCLDIDGVCSPIGQNLRYHCHAPHAGFVPLANQEVVQVHPALPTWAAELADAYDHVAWISTWNTRCAGFAVDAGMAFAADWPYLPGAGSYLPGEVARYSDALTDGRDPLPWPKLDAVQYWIHPDQPVAIVDDDLVTDIVSYRVDEKILQSIRNVKFGSRRGPTLLVAPAPEIGLTREAVDLLCAFARNPGSHRFDLRGVLQLNQGNWIQWPSPLPPDQENPVAVFPEDEEAWEAERMEQMRQRSLEVFGYELLNARVPWGK